MHAGEENGHVRQSPLNGRLGPRQEPRKAVGRSAGDDDEDDVPEGKYVNGFRTVGLRQDEVGLNFLSPLDCCNHCACSVQA